MTDKEKIIAYIDKLLEKYPKNYYLLMVAEFIDSLQEEPLSEDLEEAAKEYANSLSSKCDKTYVAIDFKAGAKWQKEKDDEEKVLTYKRDFEDCKEYINEVLLSEVLPCFMHGGEADEVVAKLDEVLNQKK